MLIVPAITAVLTEAPNYIALAKKVKDFFAEMFKQGMITTAEQDRIDDFVDEVLDARRRGQVPPEFTVEPDPES